MKKLLTLLLPVLLVLSGTTVQADPDMVLITGEHWVTSSLEQKRAFVFGIGSMGSDSIDCMTRLIPVSRTGVISRCTWFVIRT